MVASWAEVQTLAGHGWPGCPWRLALPEASGGSVFGSELGTPRALDRAQQGGRPGKDRRPGVGLATHCVVGQVRPTLGQQSACTESLHCSQPLLRGTLGQVYCKPML